MYYLQQFFAALLYPLQALLSSPGKVSSSARRLASISLPARIAMLMFVFLIFLAIAFFAAWYWKEQKTQSWDDVIRLWYILLPLMVAIPIVLYYVLRLWLEGEVSRYPDIDYAWKAGLAELNANGLDLGYTPLFLVLGSPGELQERVLFSASQLPLRLREIPTGAAALHWYAEPNGIYLVCTDVGCLSKLAALAKLAGDEARARPGRTMEASIPGNVRGTMVLDQGPEPAQPGQTAQHVTATQLFPTAAPQSRQDVKGTIMISRDQDEPVVQEVERRQVLLSQEAQREQELRLEYLCSLLAKSRQPLAPINGIMTLLPYSIVQTGRREGSELQRVVKRDLGAVVRKLKLRCSVVSLVIGMEEESGFRELVRRIGRESAMSQRFGKGFSVGNPPIPEQLEAVAAHACGLFEAKIYQLFREKGSLTLPGNTKLYALLCKIRRTVRTPLANILVNGFAHDPDLKSDAETSPLFFSGCYFAATGEGDGRQAFVKGVFEKLPAEQEELAWTDSAVAEDERYRKWSMTTMWIDGVLLMSLAGMILWWQFVQRQ